MLQASGDATRARADELAVALDVARADASAASGAARRALEVVEEERDALRGRVHELSEELQSSRASLHAAAPPPAVAGDDVLATLRVIGIEQHAARLAGDEIDVETLALLTEADMRELGLPMGAIVRLRSGRRAARRRRARRGARRGVESSARSAWSTPIQAALVPCGHLSVCLECTRGLAGAQSAAASRTADGGDPP